MDPVVASVATTTVDVIQDRSPPPAPDRIPYPATEENIPKLKQYILDNFANSAFNREPPFPAMNTKPGHIHLKSDAIPYAKHNPIPIPRHLEGNNQSRVRSRCQTWNYKTSSNWHPCNMVQPDVVRKKDVHHDAQ